jgi:protein-S-isoprenylcysteine O-methyltransferase Ste14
MGLIVTPLPLLALALVFFMAGTEFRVRIEDALLASRFGSAFEDYRRRVAAYIPFVY